MTINATAPLLLAFYVAVADARGDGARAPSAARCRTTCSRSTSRAAPTSIRPQAVAAADHRRVRVHGAARCRSGTASRCRGYHMREAGCDGGAGAGVHAGRRPRLPGGGPRARPRPGALSPGASRSSSTRTTTCSRRWPSSAPRASCGRNCCVERFGMHRPRGAQAALPHADRGLDADRAAAAQQRRARHRAGAGRGARRHAVAAHEQLRRSARPALARVRAARAAHAAGARVRERRHRHRRPARRLVLRRGADRRPRDARARPDRRTWTAWAACSRPSRAAGCRSRSISPPTSGSATSRAASAWWWASTSSPTTSRVAAAAVRAGPRASRRERAAFLRRLARLARRPRRTSAAMAAVAHARAAPTTWCPPILAALDRARHARRGVRRAARRVRRAPARETHS